MLSFSPLALPAEPWAVEDAHTVLADCLGELFGGVAMTRRKRLLYKMKGTINSLHDE